MAHECQWHQVAHKHDIHDDAIAPHGKAIVDPCID